MLTASVDINCPKVKITVKLMTPVNYLEGNKTLTNNILLKNKRILQHNFDLLQFLFRLYK